VKLVHLIGFIIKKLVTMHGHTNVKFLIMKFLFALLLSVLGLVTECIKNMYSVLSYASLPNSVTIKRDWNLVINFHVL